MFILEARSAGVEIGGHEQMRRVTRYVDGPQYRGLTERMLAGVEAAATLDDGSLTAAWLAPQPQGTLRRVLPEVFFGSTSMFVLVPAGKRVDAWEVRQQEASSGLDGFCSAVTSAVRDADIVDGDADELPTWRRRSSQVRPTGPSHDADASGGVTLDADERAAAQILADDEARGFITELVRSGSSITDLDDSPMAKYSTLGDLHRYGLIEREYVIICRQDHRTLGRIGELDDTARQSILQLGCPTCGRRFSEELLRQVHAPSRAAIELVRDGTWRPAWVLGLFEDRGFDLGQITRLSGSGSNGTALRVDTLHGRLLVELPEAEFGMQHAHALIRRLQRQNIAFGLVLATEPVSDDAYQYLSDRVANNQGPMVSVLEGSQAIRRELADAINEWSVISVRMQAEELVDLVGIDFGPVIESWMRGVGDVDETAPPAGQRTARRDTAASRADGATVTELPPRVTISDTDGESESEEASDSAPAGSAS